MSKPPASGIRWYQRLDTRVAASVSLIVALAVGSALVAMTRSVTARAMADATADLRSARVAFGHLVDDRAQFAASQAALVTALPVFRAHFTQPELVADPATLDQMADDYRLALKASFAIVADGSARWMAAPGWQAGTATQAVLTDSIAGATAGRPERAIVTMRDRLYLVVSEPARFAEEVLGSLTVGIPLDDTLAERLAAETGCDVNLVAGHALAASSLTGANRSALAHLVASGDPQVRPAAGLAVRRIANSQYTIGVYPLLFGVPDPAATADDEAQLILLQDWSPTAQFLAESRRKLGLVGVAIFLPALAVGIAFSRWMIHPLQDLVGAAGDISGGNWSRQIELSGGAETRMMARAFNEMTTNLRHWYEEAKRRDDQFRQAQKMEAVGRLAGGVAHDFNNLLTAIKGYSELLSEELAGNDPRREEVAEIIKAADRAAELTRQLLAFSRRQVVTPRVLSLTTIVAGTEHMLRRLIGEDVELVTVAPRDLWAVNGDTGQLEHMLVNLAVNARDAMPDGGRLTVELSNVVFGNETGVHHNRLPPGEYVQLSVADTGVGMTEEVAARIFEPFFTTKEVGRGTGLGLAMVYGVVDQSGGAIDVETAPGRGTTFRVFLPRSKDANQADAATATPMVPESLRGTETILLVEDDRHVNALLSRALGRAGYHILAAMHGNEALEAIRSFHGRVDLLLTDVVMPGMNGRELSERVASARPETRVLFMSGYSDDAVLRHGLKTATAHFIQKPFSIDALAAKIRRTLDAQPSVQRA